MIRTRRPVSAKWKPVFPWLTNAVRFARLRCASADTPSVLKRGASAAIPKFANKIAAKRCELRNQDTSGPRTLCQNIPFGLARGKFGATQGAEFFGSPANCSTSQCSTALPSASIL